MQTPVLSLVSTLDRRLALLFQSEKAELEVACRVQIGNLLISRGAFVDAENHLGRHPFNYGRSAVRNGITAFMSHK